MKKYFSNKYIKISVLNSLLKVLNDSSDRPNKLIIHTANGIYIGTLKPYIDRNYEIKEDDDIMTVYNKVYLEEIDKAENSIDDKTERVSENSITITLEDVELISSNLRTTMPYVVIFIDQIIGISLGSFSQK